MSTTVLATKLMAPSPRRSLVARPRLRRLLDGTLEPGHRLTLVSAPAGFGKTTAVTDWCATRLVPAGDAPAPASVAWVSVDQGDNHAGRLLAHVLAALAGAGLPVDPGEPDADVADALPAVVNDAARACATDPEHDWVLVLDDYHAITDPGTHEAVAFLLDHLPPQVHLLLTTRADPPLPLARLRSRGQLVELRAADLRFGPDEARQFLAEVMGVDLDDAAVTALDRRTEGWAAGLQLAGLSLRDLGDGSARSAFVADFAGSNRFVLDYLAEEVLTRQPPDVRDFLLRTSVLSALTGDLCDAVTGRAGGAATLDRLERDNVFVVPLDPTRTWYRYHHLFADVLSARLLAERPDEVPLLHRRASDWYDAHGQAEEAVRHALAAGDADLAGRLVEAGLGDARRARRDDLLLAWVDALPDTVVRRSPVLSMTAAFARLMTGDLAAAEALLDGADALLAAGRADATLRATWPDTEDLRTIDGALELYRASIAQARGDVAGTLRHARAALEASGPDDHFVRGGGAGFLGLGLWAAGDVRQGLETFTVAVESLHAAGNLVDALDATVVLADMWLAAGRPGRARALYDDALRTATSGGPPYPRATADLHVGLAELDLERDDLASAEAHLETARVLAKRATISENRYRWYAVAARLRAATGDHAAALDLLDEARARYRPGFYPDLRPLPSQKARVQLAAGDLRAAEAWAATADVDTSADPSYLHEHAELTLARLALARHRQDDLSGWPARLRRLEAAAAAGGRDGSLLEVRVVRALVEQALGQRDEARRTLALGMAEAPEPDAYARLLLDEEPAVTGLLPAPVAARLQAARAHPGPTSTPTLPDPLSERELEVLRRLAGEQTGPELARDLYISLNTLRTHTKRIFTKLDVGTRAAAVRRGRELGLL